MSVNNECGYEFVSTNICLKTLLDMVTHAYNLSIQKTEAHFLTLWFKKWVGTKYHIMTSKPWSGDDRAYNG